MKIFFIFMSIIFSFQLFGQQKDDSYNNKLKFNGDFRFRMEHDWNSRKANGAYRDDRSRLRYRFRYGLTYKLDSISSFGARLRSGNLSDQQGPHVTLGNTGEFELIPIGIEKIYYRARYKNFDIWVGKNSMPLKKINEIFWNDNVIPEGISVSYFREIEDNAFLQKFTLNAAHFIIKSKGKLFHQDQYLQLFQINLSLFNNTLDFFPAYYRFHQVANIPDNMESYYQNYSIIHLGSQLKFGYNQAFKVGLEYYRNMEDYSKHIDIQDIFKNQKTAYVLSASYGKLKEKGDWIFYVAYAHVQKYAIVDYYAQNDYGRWDYSSSRSYGSRLSNFKGFECKIAYNVKKNLSLNLRAYHLEQLIKTGKAKENGNRIRLDLNISF